MDQGTRKKKRSSRRSSILKIGRSPPRGALCDLDPNAPLEDDTRKLRLSRRVSFAETCQVKEFVKDSWNSSNQQHPGSEQDARATENTDPSDVPKNISGLDSLLNGEIKSDDVDICGKTTSVANFGEPNDIDDEVFLPGDTLNFQSGDSNLTILSQTAMDFTCVMNNQGSSVTSTGTISGLYDRTILSSNDMDLTNCITSTSSDISNRTILGSSDMDMTSCVKSHLSGTIPSIMITRPSNEEVPTENILRARSSYVAGVPTANTEVSPVKLSTAAFLKKMSKDSSGNNNSASEQSTSNPKASDISVNRTASSFHPAIYVPERPLSPSTGKRNVPREPYSLNNDTDFNTIINTSVNKYTGRPHVSSYVNSSVTASMCETISTDHTVCNISDDTTAMELTACLGREAERCTFNNWSTETTRVFGTENTSRMDLTLGREIGIYTHVRNTNTHVFASQLQSALNTVAEVGNKTKVFSGDDDTADMEFTACLTSNLAQLKCGVTAESPKPEDNICNPVDVERNEDNIASFKIDAQAFLNKLKGTSSTREGTNIQDTEIPARERKTTDGLEDMEFTGCLNQTSNDVCREELISTQPSYQKILDNTSQVPVVDSRAFLKKLTCGNISSSQNTTQNNIYNPVDVERSEDGIASFKIDAQAFLKKLKGTSSTREGTNIQDTEIPTRERKTTEGSEDMEFTRCLNQTSNDVCREGLNSAQPSYQKILDTEVLVDDISNKKAPEHIPPDPEQTHIFHHEEENMEFTACFSGTLKEASRVEEQTSPVTDKTKVFSSEENMEFTACFDGTLKSNALVSQDVSILGDKTKIFDSVEKDDMEFTTCVDTVARCTAIAEKDDANVSENALIFESERKMEGVQVMTGKLCTEETSDSDFNTGREVGNTATLEEHSEGLKPRKRAHPNSDANNVKSRCGPIDCNRNANEEAQTELSLITDKRKGSVGHKDSTNNTKHYNNSEDTKTPEEIEPDLRSPVPEEITGLKGLMNKVKKARKSIGSGETTCVFNSEMTLAQMDFTCIGGNDLHGISEKSPVKQEENVQPDTTRIFQQDEMTLAMEVTKCVTTSLHSVNERADDVISSGDVPNEVAVTLTLDKLPLNQTLQMKSSSTENTLEQESNTKDRSSSTDSVDIMNEMPPSLMEISVNSTTQSAHKSVQSTSLYESVIQEPRPENMMIEPLICDAMSSGCEKELNEEVQRRNEMVVNAQNLSVENVCDDNSSDLITNETLKAAEKSLLHSTELECPDMTRNSPDDLSKTSEDAMKDSMLLSVATMNKSLGLLPANVNCIEPKVTKGLSSISFVQKDQLSLCDEPPKSIDDFLALLGFHSYNDRLCRRSTLAPYSMKSPETLSEHLELGTVIEPKVQVYEWACDQMEAMTKKIQRSNDDLGTSLLRNLPQPFVEVTNPETSSKVKQTFKPIIRSCKLKADQIIKEWRSKMVNSEMDALRQETQLMQKAVQQLRDGISSLDTQLSSIQAESSKLGSILEDIEKEEPASDEQVQQFEDYEEQILTVTAELDQKEEREQSLRSELQVIRRENELLVKQIEDMKDAVNNCPSPPIPHVSQDVLWEQADDIHLCTEWELKSISEDHIVISWLFNSLDMDIELAPSASNKTAHNRYLISIKFVSQLSDDAAPWAFLAQRMVTEAVSTRVLDAKYPTTKDLGKMLEELSPIVWNARILGDEMSDVCLFHDTVINGCKATVKFVSLAAFAKFTVTFKFQPGKYPMELLEWDLNCEVGDLGRDDLDPVLTECQPGQFYLHRLVKSIQSFLERRAQEIKTTHWS